MDCIFSGNQLYPGLDPVFKLVSKRNTTQVNQDQTLSLIYSTIKEAIFVNYPHLSSFSFLNFIHWINHSFFYSYWECLGSCTISNVMIELAGVLGWLFQLRNFFKFLCLALNAAFAAQTAWLEYSLRIFFLTPMPRRRESNPHHDGRSTDWATVPRLQLKNLKDLLDLKHNLKRLGLLRFDPKSFNLFWLTITHCLNVSPLLHPRY